MFVVTGSCYCCKAAKPKIMIGIISLVGRFKGLGQKNRTPKQSEGIGDDFDG